MIMIKLRSKNDYTGNERTIATLELSDVTNKRIIFQDLASDKKYYLTFDNREEIKSVIDGLNNLIGEE